MTRQDELEEEAAMPRKELAEIVTRRFRIERGPEGEVERVHVEGRNAKGRRHWFLVWTGKQTSLSWLDVSWLLSIDLVVPPLALRSGRSLAPP
jgi:hypothetical protein